MNDGLFWSARLNNGLVEFYRAENSTQGAAEFHNSDIPIKYIVLENNIVREMTQSEKDAVDLAEQERIVAEQERIAQDQTIIEQERIAARLAHFTSLIPSATVFRITMRKHFGDNAETNTEITETYVKNYFINKQMAGTITALEVADALILDKLYVEIMRYTGDNTTWSFPWSDVP
jgi:hypothetical protein